MIGRRLLRDQRGMIGKILIFWLLVLAVVAIGAIDTASITIARVHVSGIVNAAAREAATTYQQTHNATAACKAAAASIAAADASISIRARGCKVNALTGGVTITATKRASTIVAGRLGFTKRFATISVSESIPSASG